jgi:signal transduction histidine kinase
MKIRNRLAMQFTIIVASILLIISFGIYYTSATFRQIEFQHRLEMRAISNAKLLLDDVNNKIDRNLLYFIDRNIISSLSDLQVHILDEKNRIVYTSSRTDSSFLEKNYINKLNLNTKIRFKIDGNDGVGLIFIDNQKNKYKLLAWANDKAGIQQLENLKLILIISFFVGIFIIAIAGYFFAKRSLMPISNVIYQVDLISASNLNLRLNTGKNKDEIAQLSATFNQMLQRLEDAFRMQRSFVSNASHELRTPLTAITGQIEVALLNLRQPAEYEKLLKSLLEDIKTLNTLSNGLLDLAQLNSDQSGLKYLPVRVDDVLLESQTNLMKLNSRYTICVDFIDPPEDDEILTIMGNPNLLSIVFNNLLDNACKFSENHKGEVKISCKDNKIQIVIKDSGIGIPPDELDKVFEPFYRAKNSGSKYGHGIGLSLSKKIIELHRGEIYIQSKENVGTEIIIVFNKGYETSNLSLSVIS